MNGYEAVKVVGARVLRRGLLAILLVILLGAALGVAEIVCCHDPQQTIQFPVSGSVDTSTEPHGKENHHGSKSVSCNA